MQIADAKKIKSIIQMRTLYLKSLKMPIVYSINISRALRRMENCRETVFVTKDLSSSEDISI